MVFKIPKVKWHSHILFLNSQNNSNNTQDIYIILFQIRADQEIENQVYLKYLISERVDETDKAGKEGQVPVKKHGFDVLAKLNIV